MATETEIANMALSHIGEGTELQNFMTDDGAEATACRRFMSVATETTLRDFDWGFARKITAFNLVETDPNDNWAFSYRYPADCLNFRGMITGSRERVQENMPDYQIGVDQAGQLIFTNVPDMKGAYTARVTNTGLYPPDFTLALSYYLALLILPRITAGDPFKRTQALMQLYSMTMSKARAHDANEAWAGPPPESEFIRARNTPGEFYPRPTSTKGY